MTVSRLADELKCGWDVMNRQLQEMQLEPHRRFGTWTPSDAAKLKKLVKKHTAGEIAEIMGWPIGTIRKQAKQAGLAFKNSKFDWTPEELDTLRRGYGYIPLSRLAKELKRSECAVTTKAHALGLGPVYASSDDIPLAQFCRDTGLSYSRILTVLAVKHDFPIKSMKPGRKRIYHYVNSGKILKWLRTHQDLYDASGIPLHYFGTEPKWLKDKRTEDWKRKNEPGEQDVKKGAWTKSEVDKALYMFRSGVDYDGIAHALNRTRRAVRAKLNRMGESWKLPHYWQGKDFRYIRDNYETKSDAEIAEALGRSEHSVAIHRQASGYLKKDLVKAEKARQEAFVGEHWHDMSDQEMGAELKLCETSIRNIRRRNGWLRDLPSAERACSAEEEQYVIDNWQTQSNREMADHLKRSTQTIRKILKKHGIKRP